MPRAEKWPKTLADDPQLMYELRVHRDALAVFDPTCSATEVYAPCCGRVVVADAILDVRHILSTIVRGGGYHAPQDQDWLCDGCRSRMIRDTGNDWTTAKLLARCGAPAVAVRRMKIRERLDEMERDAIAAGCAFKPDEACALATLEVDRAIG